MWIADSSKHKPHWKKNSVREISVLSICVWLHFPTVLSCCHLRFMFCLSFAPHASWFYIRVVTRFFGLPRRLFCSVSLLGGGEGLRNFRVIAFCGLSVSLKKKEMEVCFHQPSVLVRVVGHWPSLSQFEKKKEMNESLSCHFALFSLWCIRFIHFSVLHCSCVYLHFNLDV